MEDGEVILAPTYGTEFSGTTLPDGLSLTPWFPGGGATVGGGVLRVDGARVGTTALYGPGRRLEFSAAFNGAAFDAAGFGTNFLTAPMARFATRLFGLVIYANTNNGEERLSSLAGLFLGAQHRYRIDWTDTGFAYATDGIPRVTHLLGVGREMRPLFSDLFVGGKELILDWIWMSPYESSASFTSRVFDGGASVVWTGLAATTDLPAGTAIELETRTGGTPVPDETWSPWAPVAGGTIGSPGGRFIQYRVNLSTSDRDVTPVLSSVALSLFADCTPEVCNGVNDDCDGDIDEDGDALCDDRDACNVTVRPVQGPDPCGAQGSTGLVGDPRRRPAGIGAERGGKRTQLADRRVMPGPPVA